MGTIIAIGGMKKEIEDIKGICEKMINQSKKENPKFLYIPTANKDHKEYSEFMKKFFTDNYLCNVDILWLINQTPSTDEIKEKILNADIIFVEGGNLLTLLETWKRYGIDEILYNAYKNGTIMAGISAGANCWFEQSFSDSVEGKEFTFVKGLGFIQACICPHYNNEKRRKCFENEINSRDDLPNIAIGIEENSAIIIEENKVYKISEDDINGNGVHIMQKNSL